MFTEFYPNFQTIKESTGGTGYIYAWASILRVGVMLRVADIYGPIPYSEMGKGEFQVAYDDVKTLYHNMFDDLTRSINVLSAFVQENEGKEVPVAEYDIIYNGDFSKWIKYANSLKLRMAVRIASNTEDTEYAKQMMAICDMLTQIINARILTPQGWLKDGSVLIRDNKILEVTNCDLAIIGAKLIDAKGMYIVPGGVEIHVHGGGGRDFMEGTEEAFRTAIKAHMQHGTTSIFPTLSSSTIPMIRAAAATTEKMMAEPNSPVLGLHLEGHYFNMDMAGGQIPENIKDPDPEEYIPLLEETHCIKRWDAAPELPGAMQFGKYITAKGVLASVGHTQAEFEDIQTAYEAGYTHATHFYNAMPGFHKRKEYKYEGTVESIYLIDDMTVEVVADGIHVPPTILRLVYKIKGVERTCLITDALACAASDSQVAFDPRVIIEDGVCKLADHSALAGSVATMDRLIRTMVQKAEIPLEDAVRMASETPARIMGVLDRKGTLERGKDADIIALDRDLNVRAVWAMGELVEGTNKLF